MLKLVVFMLSFQRRLRIFCWVDLLGLVTYTLYSCHLHYCFWFWTVVFLVVFFYYSIFNISYLRAIFADNFFQNLEVAIISGMCVCVCDNFLLWKREGGNNFVLYSGPFSQEPTSGNKSGINCSSLLDWNSPSTTMCGHRPKYFHVLSICNGKLKE